MPETDHVSPEGPTDPVGPSPVPEPPPADYTWRELWLWSSLEWQAKDTDKVALSIVIAMAEGEAGVLIDKNELAGHLERSVATAEQALRALAEVGFIELGAGMNAAKHPIRTFITAKRVAG